MSTSHKPPLNRRRWLACVLLAALTLTSCGGASKPTAVSGLETAPVVGSLAPGFALKTPAGDTVTLSSYRGERAVLVNFWATWCAPCKKEMPELQQLHERLNASIAVIGIDLDESAAQVSDFVKEVGISFTTVIDPGQAVAKQYRLIGVPSTFLIDKLGVVRAMKVGPFTSQDEINTLLKKAGL